MLIVWLTQIHHGRKGLMLLDLAAQWIMKLVVAEWGTWDTVMYGEGGRKEDVRLLNGRFKQRMYHFV